MIYAAVLGHPIGHSLSPALHNAAYQELGLDWRYEAIDVTPPDLAALLKERLLNSAEWAGFSVTMPLKSEIVPWLNSLTVKQSGAKVEIATLVTATGAANTIVKQRSQTLALLAENTDVYGIIAALREVIRHGPIEEIAILGAGATAASALAAAKELGANKIVIYTRESSSRQAIREVANRLGTNIIERNITVAAKELPEFDAVISTMPKHAADNIAANLQQQPNGALLDVVYDPSPTDIQAAWSALGGAIVGGERMLLHQAARQVELMTGQKPPIQAMEKALAAALPQP